MRKQTRRIILLSIALTLFLSTTLVHAEKININSDKKYDIVLKENSQITDPIDLFNLVSSSKKASTSMDIIFSDDEKDSYGNKVYRMKQILKVGKNRKGEKIEEGAISELYKIDEESIIDITSKSDKERVFAGVPDSSQGDGTWDPSKSAYLYSTVYYTKTTYNNVNCVEITKADGSVSNLNSGVKVYKLLVRMGQTSYLFPSARDQIKEENFGEATSFQMYPNSSWIPVPAVYGSQGSTVGCTMEVDLGRSSSSTWNATFINILK